LGNLFFFQAKERQFIPEENQVFVHGLPYRCMGKDLEECFSAVGKVVRTFVAIKNGTPRGYAFVSFSTPEEAQEAVKRFNGYEMTVQLTNPWSKRTIIVQPSVSSKCY